MRDGIISKKRGAVIRLGKTCEMVVDILEAAGGALPVEDLAAMLGVKRPRDLVRRKNLETGKGRDGYVTRLEKVGVIEVAAGAVCLVRDWLEALNRERDKGGEIALYRRDVAKYERERIGYRNRRKVNPVNPDRHYANTDADGHVEALQLVDIEREETLLGCAALEVSGLARAIREYLDRNSHDACQPPGWIGTTLWAYDLYPGKPTPAEVRTAIEELGGDRYLRDGLRRASGAA